MQLRNELTRGSSLVMFTKPSTGVTSKEAHGQRFISGRRPDRHTERRRRQVEPLQAGRLGETVQAAMFQASAPVDD